jgi:hypothetical protein
VFFVLNAVHVLYYICRLAYFEPSLHPYDEAYLIMVYDHFIVCLSSKQTLLRIKGQISPDTIILEVLDIPLSTIDKTSI